MIKGVVEFKGLAVFVCKIKNGKSTEIIIVKVSTKQKKKNEIIGKFTTRVPSSSTIPVLKF